MSSYKISSPTSANFEHTLSLQVNSAKSKKLSIFYQGLPELACCFVLRDVLSALQYLHHQVRQIWQDWHTHTHAHTEDGIWRKILDYRCYEQFEFLRHAHQCFWDNAHYTELRGREVHTLEDTCHPFEHYLPPRQGCMREVFKYPCLGGDICLNTLVLGVRGVHISLSWGWHVSKYPCLVFKYPCLVGDRCSNILVKGVTCV